MAVLHSPNSYHYVSKLVDCQMGGVGYQDEPEMGSMASPNL